MNPLFLLYPLVLRPIQPLGLVREWEESDMLPSVEPICGPAA